MNYEETLTALFREMDEALVEAAASALSHVDLDADLDIAKARAYLESDLKTVKEKEAEAIAKVDSLRRQAGTADVRARAGWEAVRNARQKVSAVQTLAGLERSEAELAGKGPR